MKKVIRLTEGDLVRIVKRILKESDKENDNGYNFLKKHTNINVDSIIDFDGESYNDVDEFLNDVFPSAETYNQDFHRLYPVKDYLHQIFDIMESFGFEGPDDAMSYIDEWHDRRKEEY